VKVLKFGGSSLATPERIHGAAEIVTRELAVGPAAVVVSALGGVTNELVAAIAAAASRDDTFEQQWEQLLERHRQTLETLARPELRAAPRDALERYGSELRELLHGVFLLRECSPRTRDSILAYGERLSAQLMAVALRNADVEAEAIDARSLITTDATFGGARVDLDATLPRIAELLTRLEAKATTAVITGFIAATPAGETTTLGRGGSDYTATVVGAAVKAEAVELWTDVDGVMSADPRLVPEAFPLPHLSYAELMEISHFGAKVVHPPSVHPARQYGIPLIIRNTFRPDASGTRVDDSAPSTGHPIRGIASIHRIALMRLEGDGMVGVPGIAMRLFGALAREGVSVILISQASSEHSICFAVGPAEEERARLAVNEEFSLERQVGLVDELVSEADLAVIAVVGEDMRETPGIAGRLFGILGAHGINVRAIAQGSSELNISLVVAGGDETRALRAIHAAYFSPDRQRLALAVAGTGRVGAALLEQLRTEVPRLATAENLDIDVVALWNSRTMLLAREGVDLADWEAQLDQGEPADATRVLDFLIEARGSKRIFVDCTASDAIPLLYPRFLDAGIAVVAANKRPFSGPVSTFEALTEKAARRGVGLHFETTVGAGLPIVSTLENLIRSGDRIQCIDAVLSGTLNFVLEQVAAGVAFSRALRQAHADGLTEPHPGEDLTGTDVARKLCILARQAGFLLEPTAIEVVPLVSDRSWAAMELPTFWQQLAEWDEELATQQTQAAELGRRLRYVATLSAEGARVSLEPVSREHPCFDVRGADNLVAFTTARYATNPLVVHGPGAGPEVTAAGVFADLLGAAKGMA
jgi:aspartokinase/homoserine dehydrogenase 1